ncbi:hypothetical protein CEP54_009170 [Fusarium duplospermum]|uniref:Uncharacterized protein n=1 Tax=Fusarium duplospermum TaxID=1325734 RepID=A0A428PRU0_9HYPO|nr:hypothetical protein CEP54_009170 [Fusarium duplospermum]
MLFINAILLALHATISASAPAPRGLRLDVEPHNLRGKDTTVTHPEQLGSSIILESIGAYTGPRKADREAKKGKGKAKKGKGKATARQHVRRNNDAQDGSGKIGLLKSAAQAVGINPKSISVYLNNLRNDFPYEVQDSLPTCLSQTVREGLSAIETSLSSIPKCVSDSDDEIEIDTDGVEVDADGLPACLDKAGQDALSSIQTALADFGDCATATPLAKV